MGEADVRQDTAEPLGGPPSCLAGESKQYREQHESDEEGVEQELDRRYGDIQSVTDRQILSAYRLLAQKEGVFVEPASAASVAGLLQASAAGLVERGEKVVCTVTGNGLKDPDWAISGAPKPVTVANSAAAAATALGLA